MTVPSIGRVPLLGLSLICGGGMSNLMDRVLFGGTVVDFVILRLGGFRTGVFNLADVAVSVGVALFLVGAVRRVLRGRAQ